MENELKPCPFCGHNPKLMTDNYEDKHVYWPQCLDPDCIMSESASTWPTANAAIAAWNARAGAPAIDAGEVERLVDEYGRESRIDGGENYLDESDNRPAESPDTKKARAALIAHIGNAVDISTLLETVRAIVDSAPKPESTCWGMYEEGQRDEHIRIANIIRQIPLAAVRKGGGSMSEWMPIETAPKDGTRILAFDGAYQHVVAWRDTYTMPCAAWSDFSDELYVPTHWMPLPAPPMPDANGGTVLV